MSLPNPLYTDPELKPSQRRVHYFDYHSAACKHGIIGIEYEPQAYLPQKHHLSRLGQWLIGQSHAGPITTLLIDDERLHAWMSKGYGEGFSRVRFDANGRVIGANHEYHSRPMNDLCTALGKAYEALPGVTDKAFISYLRPALDWGNKADIPSADTPNDERDLSHQQAEAKQWRLRVICGARSCVAMRLARPDWLPDMLKNLTLPTTNEPLIDQADFDAAMRDLQPTFADRIDHQRRQREAQEARGKD